MSKYSDYYQQVKVANHFPLDIKAANPNEVATALQRLVKKEKLPFVVKKKYDRIIINKKADA